MDMKLCEICKEESHKYKCPVCRVKYCSLPCYKLHKSAGCERTQIDVIGKKRKEQEPEEGEHLEQRENVQINYDAQERISEPRTVEKWKIHSKSHYPNIEVKQNEDVDVVPFAKLQTLQFDANVMETLKNPHLKEMILHISENEIGRGMLIAAAMREPVFSEFATACLKCVEGEKF